MKKKFNIRKNDSVMVIAGNGKGEIGRVLELYPKNNRVLVEGVNVRYRHTKPSQQNQKGGRIEKELPIHVSNVMLVDSDKNPTRVYFKREEENGKMVSVRYAKSNDKKI